MPWAGWAKGTWGKDFLFNRWRIHWTCLGRTRLSWKRNSSSAWTKAPRLTARLAGQFFLASSTSMLRTLTSGKFICILLLEAKRQDRPTWVRWAAHQTLTFTYDHTINMKFFDKHDRPQSRWPHPKYTKRVQTAAAAIYAWVILNKLRGDFTLLKRNREWATVGPQNKNKAEARWASWNTPLSSAMTVEMLVPHTHVMVRLYCSWWVWDSTGCGKVKKNLEGKMWRAKVFSSNLSDESRWAKCSCFDGGGLVKSCGVQNAQTVIAMLILFHWNTNDFHRELTIPYLSACTDKNE